MAEKKQLEIFDFHDHFFRVIQDDDDTYIKAIKDIEKIVRSSIEYKRYIQYLKQELGRTSCAVFKKIDVADAKGVSLEFHHYPLTLFDIVQTIVNRYRYDKHVDCFAISNEVMMLHYNNEVQLIPLAKTIHELAHDGMVEIPKSEIHGDCSQFVERYKQYVLPETMMKYDQCVTRKETGSNERILRISRIEYELDDTEYAMIEYDSANNKFIGE